MSIYLVWEVEIVLLLTKTVTVSTKCLNFIDVFLNKSATKLPKRSDINGHFINSSNLPPWFIYLGLPNVYYRQVSKVVIRLTLRHLTGLRQFAKIWHFCWLSKIGLNRSFSMITILLTPTTKSFKILALIAIRTNNGEVIGVDTWLIDKLFK